MLPHTRTACPHKIGQLIAHGLLLAIMTAIATGLLAAPDESAGARPEVPVIRQQVADILSQPEYQDQYPQWLQGLLGQAWEWLAKLLERIPFGEAVRGLYATWPVVYWAIVGLLALAIAALLYHIFITIRGAFGHPGRPRRAKRPSPLPLTSPAALRRQARQLASHGDFAGALRKLYESCLRYLDQRGYLHYHPATTNGEYLQQVDGHPELTVHLQPITRAMDRLCYAHIGLGHATYEHLDTLAQQLWQEVEK